MKISTKTADTFAGYNFIKILRGSAVSIIITIVSLIIFGLILAYSDLSENVVTPVVIAISGVSILIGGMLSSMKIKKQGLINGGMVGLLYIALIYILSSFIDRDFSLSTSSIIMILTCILTGAIRWDYWS